MQVAQSSDQTMTYVWTKPLTGLSDLYEKKLYVRHFAPLGWYICVSYYYDEINLPVKKLTWKMVMLSGAFLIIAIILSFLLARVLAAPLKKTDKGCGNHLQTRYRFHRDPGERLN